MSGARNIEFPDERRDPDDRRLRIIEAYGNNLQRVTLDLPVGLLTCVTGVSGSGKSTLINDTLYHAVAQHPYGPGTTPTPHGATHGPRPVQTAPHARRAASRPT